ncbi:MAG: hypothetical protein HY544_00325 [Candidatus Diapherotrites archaeon]|uniref:homoserine dehydrogenase n=1 Tax=Candidatus Iainarchaeum sp. TaxID=3101447 RepID=A0A8T3YNY3_9ARCH|nr:hypothetical protein [Candidatus Diapherotrites archaeon]
MIQDVFIIGATGNVGSTLVRQIIERRDADAKLHNNPTRIVGLASNKSLAYSSRGIGPKEALSFSAGAIVGKPLPLPEILSLALGGGHENLAFVDVTALKDEMLGFHKKVIGKTGFTIVTANKNPLAYSDNDTFQRLVREVPRYGFRCSVMAGAEAVSLMLDLRDLNDELVSLAGCFSGTLNFITSELQRGERFSKSVRSAVSLGYSEPNPADDLSGEDVAKKMLILVRSAGFEAEMGDVELKPFVPKEVLGADQKEEFLKALEKLDPDFSGRALRVRQKGSVLRYVARAENSEGGISMRVGLEEIQEKSPLGHLDGTSNKIVAVTRTYTAGNPYVVEAPGAGPEVTAQNIRRDLLAQIGSRVLRA